MTTVPRLHEPLHQLPLLEHGSVVQTEGLHPVTQGAAGVAVQHIGAALLIHRHHLTLHALRSRYGLAETPASPVGVAVEAEGPRGGLAELSEALLALDLVGVGGDQQTARLQLDAMARAESKGGPICQEGGNNNI